MTLYYCSACNSMVQTSFIGKCKTCGKMLEIGKVKSVDSAKWAGMSKEEQDAFVNSSAQAAEKQAEAAAIPMVTTTPGFEGKTVEQYLGTVYGTEIYLVGGLMGGGLSNQEKLFGSAFDAAKKKMFDKAVALGGNAVVGMQVTVTSPGNLNNIIVIVTGTAVKLY